MDAKNMDFTLEELKILAENGQKDLEYAVGYYYENGIHTLTDFGQAAQWYEKAAKKDHSGCLLQPGISLCPGKGVDKERKKKRLPISDAPLKPAIKMPSTTWPGVMRKGSVQNKITQKPLAGIKKQGSRGIIEPCAAWAVTF